MPDGSILEGRTHAYREGEKLSRSARAVGDDDVSEDESGGVIDESDWDA